MDRLIFQQSDDKTRDVGGEHVACKVCTSEPVKQVNTIVGMASASTSGPVRPSRSRSGCSQCRSRRVSLPGGLRCPAWALTILLFLLGPSATNQQVIVFRSSATKESLAVYSASGGASPVRDISGMFAGPESMKSTANPEKHPTSHSQSLYACMARPLNLHCQESMWLWAF